MPNETPNSRDDSADWDAIARYFAGESSPDETVAVRRWLEAHPTEASALGSLNDATALLANATPPDLDVEAALKRVIERRDAAAVIPIGNRPTRRTSAPATMPARRWQPMALRVAAAAVLAVGAGLWWHTQRTGGYSPMPGGQTFATNVGQRDSVRLADGTRVLLAPESRLTVAEG